MRVPAQLRPLLIAAAIGLALAGVMAEGLFAERRVATVDIEKKTRDLTGLLEKQTHEILRRIEFHLVQASAALGRNSGSDRDVASRLRQELPADDLVLAYEVTDATGAVIMSTQPEGTRHTPDPAASGYFTRYRDGARRNIEIGAPLQSRVDGRWILPVSRRLTTPGGDFGGVLVAVVDLTYFQRLFDSIDTGTRGFVTLFLADGWIVATAPFNEPVLRRNWIDSPMFREHLPRSPAATVRQVVARDSIERIYSYQLIEEYRLIVALGISLTDALADWRARLARECILLLLGLGLLFGGALALRKQLVARDTAASALQESENNLRTLIEHLPVGVTLIKGNDDLRFTAFNRLFLKMYDLPPGFIKAGDSVERLVRHLAARGDFGPEDVDAQVREWRARVRDPTRYRFEVKRRDGRTFALDRTPSPDGGLVTTHNDITARLAAEDQLRHAQRMEAVGRMTGGITHDFNNLLAVIMGNLELLEERLDAGTEPADRVATALRAVRHGSDLTHRLLAFSGRQSLDPQTADLRMAAAAAEALLRHTLPEFIEVELRSGAQPATATVDMALLENALLNLGLNARDAMPGGGRLVLSAGIEEVGPGKITRPDDVPAGRYATVAIADSGVGIPPDIVSRVFEPFFTTKPVGQGTGLGLSMVYGFVRQSGGYVDLISVPGKGTTIRLLFPVVDAAVAGSSDVPRPPVGTMKGQHRILLVEDMPDVRQTIAGMLGRLGFMVVEASDGDTALSILSQDGGIDGMLTDIGLPGTMNGAELATAAAARWPGLKIATMSGYAEGNGLARAKERQDRPHLAKPISLETLAVAMTTLFADAGDAR